MAIKTKKKRKITRLCKYLHENDISLVMLNKQTGVSRPVLSQMSKGKRSTFNESTLRLVGQAVNIPFDELLMLVDV